MKDNKIKICFVSPFAYSLFNPKVSLKFGGSEMQMYLISSELARDNQFDVNFVVLDVGQKKKEVYNNVKLYRVYKRGRNILNLLLAPFKLIITLIKINPQIVVCRAAGAEVGISAFYAAIFGKKFIYSFACDVDDQGGLFGGLRGAIFKFGFGRACKFIAQSMRQVGEFKKKYEKRAGDVKIIKNSLKIKEEGSGASKDIVLWVGSSASLKRPQVFLDLARDFPQEKFVMIMTKSKMNLDLWEEIDKKRKEFSNLEFLESVPFSEVDKYFAQAKVFVNTSTVEGFPNTFIQAWMHHTPTISLNVDPDGIIDKYNIGIVSDDIAQLNLEIMHLLENNQERIKMGDRAFNYVVQHHNIESTTKRIDSVFKEITNQNR